MKEIENSACHIGGDRNEYGDVESVRDDIDHDDISNNDRNTERHGFCDRSGSPLAEGFVWLTG